MSRPKGDTQGRWTVRAHGYRDPDACALEGGQWVRRGMVWKWEKPAPLSGSERRAWDNESGPSRAVSATQPGPDPLSFTNNERG